MTTLTLPPPMIATAPASEPATGRRVVRPFAQAVRAGTSLLLLAAVLLFAALAVGPHLLGYRTVTMLSGSMSPEIPAGRRHRRHATARDRSAPRADHHLPGAHRRPPRRQSPGHRRHPHCGWRGQRAYQGDANASPDQWTAQLQGQRVWQARTVIPGSGR